MWPFYYSHYTDTLYRRYREEWHQNGEFYYDCHTMIESEHNTYNYVTSGYGKLLPEDASPTDVMDMKDRWRISGHLPMKKKEKTRVRSDTFMEYLMEQEEHISQYYTKTNFLMVPYKIYELTGFWL
jgi:hypothetical protein